MSMGMMMVPPAVVSLPFKLAFFVIADGWSLLAGALVQELRPMTEPPSSPPRRKPEKPRPPALRPEQMPSPIEKAAMILTAIGPEQAAGFLRDLAEPDMERFARAINGLGKIGQEVLDAVIVEFLELLTTGPELSGGSKAARKLLAAVLDDEDEVQRLIDGRRRSEVRSVWERLNDTPPPTLANFLQAEHPQTAAVVLSELRSEVAASVLERLERGFAQTVVLRLSRVPQLDAPVAAAIQGAIERDFLSVLQRNLSKRRPADLIAGLMNNISTEVREGFLSYLEAQEPSLAQDVQRTMFTFEDISVRLHGRDVAGVLRDVAEEVLLKALKLGEAQSSPTVAFILENLPRRLSERYVEELAGLDRRQPQGRQVGADRDHQGDPGPGQGGHHPLHREGQRLRLSPLASRRASRLASAAREARRWGATGADPARTQGLPAAPRRGLGGLLLAAAALLRRGLLGGDPRHRLPAAAAQLRVPLRLAQQPRRLPERDGLHRDRDHPDDADRRGADPRGNRARAQVQSGAIDPSSILGNLQDALPPWAQHWFDRLGIGNLELLRGRLVELLRRRAR